MNNFNRTTQMLIYGLIISSAIFTSGACATKSKDTGAAATSKTIADKDGETADNEKDGETSQAVAQSGGKSVKSSNCPTWTDVKAAAKAGKIEASSDKIPEMPAGFKNGCVYSAIGAHTLNFYVLKDDATERPILAQTNKNADPESLALYRQFPMFDDYDQKLMNAGKVVHVGFDSGMQAEERAKRYADRAHIDKENYTVEFGYVFVESHGAALEEIARLLEATKSGGTAAAAADGDDENVRKQFLGVRYGENKSSLPIGIKSVVLYWLYFDDSGSTDYTVHQVAQNGKNLLWIGLASRRNSLGSPEEWKVVDAVTLPRMSKKEVVANYCSANGAKDQAILAVYEDLGAGKQTTKVKQAWRFDRQINRLEPVSTRALVCSGLEEGEV